MLYILWLESEISEGGLDLRGRRVRRETSDGNLEALFNPTGISKLGDFLSLLIKVQIVLFGSEILIGIRKEPDASCPDAIRTGSRGMTDPVAKHPNVTRRVGKVLHYKRREAILAGMV